MVDLLYVGQGRKYERHLIGHFLIFAIVEGTSAMVFQPSGNQGGAVAHVQLRNYHHVVYLCR